MENRNYKILDVPVRINSNISTILHLLDKAYCTFIQETSTQEPMLELIVDSRNGDINDLKNIDIYAITPSSFDGWERSTKAWMGPRSNVKRFVNEIDEFPEHIKPGKKKKVFKIKTMNDVPGIDHSCIRGLYFFTNLFALDCSQKASYIIHGGALEWKNKGIILAGHAGSGKSTLTYALAKAGLNYLTDECVLFNVDTQCLLPYPISPSFEKDNAQLFDEVKETYDEDTKLHNENIKSFVDIRKVGISTTSKPVAPEFIIFPKYTPDKKPELKQLSTAKASELLNKQTSFFQDSADKNISKSDVVELLINKCECYELVSNQLDETIALVKNLFD